MSFGTQLSKNEVRSGGLSARILDLLKSRDQRRGLSLLSPPFSDISLRLESLAEELSGTSATPVIYFRFRSSDDSLRSASLRFANDFLAQLIAFRRKESRGKYLSSDLRELSELSLPGDAIWLDKYIESLGRDIALNDGGAAAARNAFGGPVRAMAAGVRCLVILDGVDELFSLKGAGSVIDDVSSLYAGSELALVLSGKRRALYGKTPFEELRVPSMDLEDSAAFIDGLASRNGVPLNASTRDLLGVILDGAPS